MGCCRFRQVKEENEKRLMTKTFEACVILQSIAVIVLCLISIYYFNSINISRYLPVDIVTMFIAVIFLTLIIIVVGWAAARSNTTFAWFFFHLFMVALLVIEIAVSLFTSDLSGFLKAAENIWNNDLEDRRDLQMNLLCCGFLNYTHPDENNQCPPSASSNCEEKLTSILLTLRNTATVSMFICFVIGLFFDFAGCAICFNPDIITVADHEREMSELAAQQMEMETFTNPFSTA
ncbi:Tetraspanin family protein [Tritrichomonas foetus]|uniref:Tetraspanin family protein n=1 Tax=Tritrichomonas foetus TaxID=1144522 RepID=A0A1J4KVL3_9EUKA|nr:Tetraspanin family protein [Tritrichomonas foetus]|eukprot:OHT13734.1 Tetraspanin family protein [Tritrichomonas foetus]